MPRRGLSAPPTTMACFRNDAASEAPSASENLVGTLGLIPPSSQNTTAEGEAVIPTFGTCVSEPQFVPSGE
jgi:hypothetical protein